VSRRASLDTQAKAIETIARDSSFVAYYRFFLPAPAEDFGFIATPTCTTCWMTSAREEGGLAWLDAGCGIVEIPLAGDESETTLRDRIRAALHSLGPADTRPEGCRGQLVAVGEVYALHGKDGLSIELSDDSFKVLQRNVGAYPDAKSVERGYGYWWFRPRPTFVRQEVVAMIRVGVMADTSVMSGVAYAPPPDTETQRNLRDWAAIPEDVTYATDAPVVDFDVYIAGSRIEHALVDDVHSIPEDLEAAYSKDYALIRTFQRVCTGPLLHSKKSPGRKASQ